MEYTFDITLKNRVLLQSFMERLSLDQLNTIPKGFNNNILWNIGHSIVTQQLLVYGLSGQPFKVSDELIASFRKGTKPDRLYIAEEVEKIKSLLFTTVEQVKQDYDKGMFTSFKAYTLSTTGGTLSSVQEALEFNNFHEGLHLGYCIALARLV